MSSGCQLDVLRRQDSHPALRRECDAGAAAVGGGACFFTWRWQARELPRIGLHVKRQDVSLPCSWLSGSLSMLLLETMPLSVSSRQHHSKSSAWCARAPAPVRHSSHGSNPSAEVSGFPHLLCLRFRAPQQATPTRTAQCIANPQSTD